ncbi:MAG: hypothetical protein ABIT69_07845 [Sphingomicrobium sp.]
MSRLAIASLAVAVLAVPAATMAKEKADPPMQAIIACASLASDGARLRCYDSTMVDFKRALDKGDLVLSGNKEPKALQGIVTASGSSGNNRFWVQLDSGDRWSLLPEYDREKPPPVGAKMKVSKEFFGTYKISGRGWHISDARYLGRRP